MTARSTADTVLETGGGDGGRMAYVITSRCVADYSCVEACPAACIHPTPDEPGFDTAEQLYIDPRACIDCAACVEACPVDAIHSAGAVPAGWEHYVGANAAFFGAPATATATEPQGARHV